MLRGSGLALTTDIWTSKATQAFATTTAHFLDSEWEPISCVLETRHFPGNQTGVRIADQINIKGDVTPYHIPPRQASAVVHDEAANVVLAGDILWDSDFWESLVCAAHKLQNAVKDSIDKRSMQNLLARCHRLVGYFKHSAVATHGMEKKQRDLGISRVLHVIQEVPNRWNSMFHMLQRLGILKQPIRLNLEDTMSEQDQLSYDLTDVQWSMCKSLLSLLEAIDQVTTSLSGERYSTLSWCLPLLFGLLEEAKCHAYDSQLLTAKKKFVQRLKARFELDKLDLRSPAVLASALDPRFRRLSFLSFEQREVVRETLAEMASGLESTTSRNSPCGTDEPLTKRKKRSILDRLLGDEAEEREGSMTDEVSQYLQEKPIKRSDDPCVWWKGNAARFPRLAVLARCYLAIPATSTPSKRVFRRWHCGG